MKTTLLGKTGLRVSQLCLGTMTFGEDWGWGADKNGARQIFDAFTGAGGNFIDTANGYTNGTSETIVGELIGGDRDAFVVATKYSFPDQFDQMPPTAKTGNARKNMLRSVEGSLKRLGTDHIDLFYVHAWDFTTEVEEVMRGLDDLVSQGKILYAGVSDAPAWIVSRANTVAKFRGWTPFSVLQIEYSLAERTPERDLIPMAKALGLSVAPWSPLAGGVLSGKYTSGEKTNRGGEISPRNLEIAEGLATIAADLGATPSQVALKWLVDKNTIPILGARKLEQFEDNLKCLEVEIDLENARQLDELTQIELGFPHDFLRRDFVRSKLIGGKYELDDLPIRA